METWLTTLSLTLTATALVVEYATRYRLRQLMEVLQRDPQ